MTSTLGRRWTRRLVVNADMLALAAVGVAGQSLVPSGTLLAREDLAPWITLVVSAVALARGAPIGPGAHPMLTPRRSAAGALLRRVALAATPWALLAWYDAGRADPTTLPFAGVGGLALAASAAVGVALWLGRAEGETAWDPPGPGAARTWGVGGLAAVVTAIALGRLSVTVPDGLPAGAWNAGLLSLELLCVGLAGGRTAHLRQRLAAGRRDGARPALVTFPMVLALFGPGVGYVLLTGAFVRAAGHPLGFGEAYAVTLFACAWGAILWRRPTPAAVGVILREVAPVGGGDEAPEQAAVAFERPPEGALRFNPLRLQRLQAVHVWIVPVRRARIDELDDPVRPLWSPPPTFPAAHVLGEAAFEPDPRTGAPQWDVLTVRLGARSDTTTVSEQDAQARRIVVLRAFPRLGGGKARRATYRWEERVPAESLQVLDATVDACTLLDGDVIVLSAEGVARAYEIELGAPIAGSADLFAWRPPQVEDYVAVRS